MIELFHVAINVGMLTVFAGVGSVSLCSAGGGGYRRNVAVTKCGGNVAYVIVTTGGAYVYRVSSCGTGGDDGYRLIVTVS